MPELENARHERFAMALTEGNSVIDAYRTAGYAPNTGNACRMKADERIRSRVAELRSENRRRHAENIDALITELEEDRNLARRRGNASAAVSATMGIARLQGLLDAEGSVFLSTDEVHDLPSAVLAATRAVDAVSSGTITPRQGRAFLHLLDDFRRMIETTSIDRRLSTIEGAILADT